MSRKININKYKGNTHYSVHVIDSFNQEHHIGYFELITEASQKIIDEEADKIWSNEVKQEPSLLDKAIANCIEIDKKNNINLNLD
jgi:hypothetical protein